MWFILWEKSWQGLLKSKKKIEGGGGGRGNHFSEKSPTLLCIFISNTFWKDLKIPRVKNLDLGFWQTCMSQVENILNRDNNFSITHGGTKAYIGNSWSGVVYMFKTCYMCL